LRVLIDRRVWDLGIERDFGMDNRDSISDKEDLFSFS
jgi:hypothetical protein